MKRIIPSKLSRKFLTLAFLLFALAFAASTNFTTQTVKANDCLLECAAEWRTCTDGCDDPNSWYPGCYLVCSNGYSYCQSLCPR